MKWLLARDLPCVVDPSAGRHGGCVNVWWS
jgi:hypothetical protein